MNHDVFISYSSKNKTTALAICHVLEEHRIKCWMAPRDIPPGADYGDVIDEAIVNCRLFVLVFSEPASLSQWVKWELNLAFTEKKIIIPYRIDETPLKGAMRLILNQTHWIEAYPDAAIKFGELVEAAGRFLRHSVSSEPSAESNPQLVVVEPVVPNLAPGPLKTYKVGDYYKVNGKEGIVFEVDALGRHGKIMAMRDLRKGLAWCAERAKERWIGASYEQNGMGNMEVVSRIACWWEKYPAFAACVALGGGWYLPAKDELKKLFDNRKYFSDLAQRFGGKPFEESGYWSSSEYGSTTAWGIGFGNGFCGTGGKTCRYRVRPVAAF